MVVQDENDPVMAMRGIPTANHKVQKPLNRPDPILQARSPLQGSLVLQRQGSIGVGSGILKERSPTNNINMQQDPSIESMGTFDGLKVKNSISRDTFGNDTFGASTLNSEARRVRWGKNVKAGAREGCGLGSADMLGDMYTGVLNKLSDMNLLTNLNVNAQKLGKGLVGLGATCAGGGKILCGACGHGLDAACQHVGKNGKYYCAKCGESNFAGNSLGIDEENDLVYRNHECSHNYLGENDQVMREALFETRDAIKESRDAIVASRDAILKSFEEVKETRHCVEDSRNLMGDCREAIIQSNDIAMYAREEQLSQATARKKFTFDQLGYGLDEDGDALGPMTSPRTSCTQQRQLQYYRSTSQRASYNNIQTGMEDGIPADEDPFSASMHAYQRSPRAIMPSSPDTSIYTEAPSPQAASSPKKPTSILKRNSSFGPNSNNRAVVTASTRSRIAPPTSARGNASRVRQLGGRLHKSDKKHRNMTFSTRNVSKKNAHATNNSSSVNSRTSSSGGQQQVKEQRKKKKFGQRVIGGIKKPLKFMSHGVKSNLKHTRVGSKRILHLTTA